MFRQHLFGMCPVRILTNIEAVPIETFCGLSQTSQQKSGFVLLVYHVKFQILLNNPSIRRYINLTTDSVSKY